MPFSTTVLSWRFQAFLSLLLTFNCSGFQPVDFIKKKVGGQQKSKLGLLAKQRNESNKKSSGSGFGTPVAKKPSRNRIETAKKTSNDDFKVFPALQDDVRATLIPSKQSKDENDTAALLNEVYDRLDQIYGFPMFNQRLEETSVASMSLGDLLSTETETASSFSSTSSLQQSVSKLPDFGSIRVLHMDPLVLAVDDFFTDEECDRYVSLSTAANTVQTKSPTVGKDSTAKAQRTSTTFYHLYETVPELLSKTARLLGLDQLDHLEEVQTVRYQRNQRFTWHLDALGPKDLASSGQRVATLLVYLTDLAEADGGATLFRDLNGDASSHTDKEETDSVDDKYLAVHPTKGSALLFFPAAGGIPGTPMDIRTLHCGQAVSSDSTTDKWIAQLWLREKPYQPTSPPGNAHSKALEAVDEYCATR